MRLFILLTAFVALFFLCNALFMLLLGAVSHIFNIPTLAVSFWQTCIVSLLLSTIGGFFRSNK